MMESICRRAYRCFLVSLIIALLPLGTQAGTINIVLSDMDVTYSGGAAGGTGSIYDVIGHAGGHLLPSESDELESAVFEMDMVQVGTLMTSAADHLWGDLKIDGVGTTLPLSAFQSNIGNNGGGFGLDFFTTSGKSLRLGMNKIDMLLSNGVMFFTGTASVISQNLPFGLKFDATKPIYFSYTATLPGIVGNPATGAMASGAMTISGTMDVPEPASFALVGFGGLIGGALLRRRSIA